MHKGKYDNVGIIWIDAHPDVSTVNDGYPNAHAMVLGSLMGQGAMQIVTQMRNPVFKPDEILYKDALSKCGCRTEETVFIENR